MKNRLKKITAMLLSIGMLMTLCVGANVKAAEPETGSITIHKFKIKTQAEYNQFVNDQTKRGNGNEITDGSLDGLEVFPDITFTLTKIVDDGTKELKPSDALVTDTSFGSKKGTTDENGEYTFNNLPLGTYLLEEDDNPKVKTKMDPVIVYVPTYNPEYKEDNSKKMWLYDIHVYPKNLIHEDGPDIDKDVIQEGNNDAGVDMYAPFAWIIKTSVPTDISSAKVYKITDKLDERLEFVNIDDMKVVIKDKDGNYYDTFDFDYDYNFTNDKGTLTWNFSSFTKLASVPDGHVDITFYTKLKDNAELGTAIPNSAKLEYTNSQGHEYDPTSDVPEVHTGGIKLLKVDKSDHNLVLQGAEFQVFKTEADAKEKRNPIKIGDVDTFTSDENGIVEINGLAYGKLGDKASEGSTEYWIVETKAPERNGEKYNLLLEPLKVVVNATSHVDASKIHVYNALHNPDLPFTGGIGTIIFVIGGIALIGAAVVLNRKGSSKAVK